MCTERERVSEAASQQGSVGGVVSPSLALAFIHAALAQTQFHGKLHHYQTVDSTQRLATEAAHRDNVAGQVFVADEQTAGRGRGGHIWRSAPGEGLYLTALVRPRLHAAQALQLSFAAGLAAQAAILQSTGCGIDLRWPNDLVSVGPASRKLGGILTESAMHPDGTLRHAAIGIGINLGQRAMSPDLAMTGTSLALLTGRAHSRQALLIALLQHLDRELQDLETAGHSTLQRFAEHSSWVTGKRVSVAEDGGYTGLTAGLTAEGLLQVACDDGSLRLVRHGGVRELP